MTMTQTSPRGSSFNTMPRLFLILCLLVASLFFESTVAKETENCDNPDPIKVVTEAELATKTGKDGAEIWLSILGEVYNVTDGGDFYTEGGAYSIFAGRDGSVPFITGIFTEEEAAKDTGFLTPAQLSALDHWRKFYEDSEKYPFVGLLAGRFYDERGEPTEEMKSVREKIASYEPPNKKKTEATNK